jgi:hypothetical protein
MAASRLVIEEWLEKNQHAMFHCPHQPGKLMISPNACAKRHLQAEKEEYQDPMKGDFFHYAYKMGLALCRNCSIGKRLTPTLAASERRPRRRLRRDLVSHGRAHLQRSF